MAILPMKKVAVLAHKKHEQAIIDLLHKEGVMEISNLPDPETITPQSLHYHGAEVEHVITVLKQYASPETMKEMEAKLLAVEIEEAGKSERVRTLIDEVHALEEKGVQLRSQMDTLKRGQLPTMVESTANLAEEGTYFTASKVKTDLSHFGGTSAKETAEMIVVEKQRVEEEIGENNARLHQLSLELPLLRKAKIFAVWVAQKEALQGAMKSTSSTITVFGWIAAHFFEPLEERLHAVSSATALVEVQPEEGEMAPVQLKNPVWLKPFESVTNLYGTPKATDVDPTPLLAPFFALFFGLCLTDAGYGLVLAIVMGLYLWKTKMSIEEGKLWWLLFLGGIITFFVSIPFGGWFGLLPDQAPAWLTETRADGMLWFKGQIWNLGETKGIAFFQNLSLVLGLFHLSFGIFLAGFCKWRAGQKAAAFWIDWTSLILFAVVTAYFFVTPEQQQNALYAMYASLVLLLWGKGYGNPWYSRFLYGLIGLFFLSTGMLGNTLSYLRLLALGLVTGALALAVNLVAQQIGAIFPYAIGLPISIVIYVVGHTANVALNVLGAFIHSGRLQFVEFFGNFFEGGGKPFSPFRRSIS
jgi:V/A-type H+/Na+-transporting ATPase subunit I